MSNNENQRTAGDGMEKEPIVLEPAIRHKQADIPESVFSESKSHTLPRLIEIIASKPLPDNRTHINKKTPKFVPYEPYAAAVKPIVPVNKSNHVKKTSRNNMDINMLISQLSLVDTKQSEFKPRSKSICNPVKSVPSENNEFQRRIDDLSKENATLREQLTQQAQVNRELKTMLVASMGEDMESQVENLNRDKRHLTTALLDSAKHLSTHQEQTEWLAGQCEVWRSKFLASSLMVEELATWKKVLSRRTDDLQQALEKILDERNRVREMLLLTYKNIYSMHEEWLSNLAISEINADFKRPIGSINLNNSKPPSSNLIDLTTACMKMSQNVSDGYDKCNTDFLKDMLSITEAEKLAEEIMSSPIETMKENEAPLHALVSHAYSQSTNSDAIRRASVVSCTHCNGKVQLL